MCADKIRAFDKVWVLSGFFFPNVAANCKTDASVALDTFLFSKDADKQADDRSSSEHPVTIIVESNPLKMPVRPAT